MLALNNKQLLLNCDFKFRHAEHLWTSREGIIIWLMESCNQEQAVKNKFNIKLFQRIFY